MANNTRASSAGSHGGGTSQSAANQSALVELNARSAPVIRLDLAVYYPGIQPYEWTEKKSGEKKSNKIFRSLLIDPNDFSQYLVGTLKMKDGKEQPLKNMSEKMKPGLRFKLSKISIESTKPEYISTTKKMAINLANTHLDPILQEVKGQPPTPQPTLSVAACLGFKKNQRFDIIALVASVSVARPAGPNRHVVDVGLVDGSVDANDKLAESKVSLFYNVSGSSDPMKDLRSHAMGTQAFFFFSLQAKEATGGHAIESTRDFFFDKSEGKKATDLAERAAALHSQPREQRRVIENEFVPSGDSTDYSAVQGTETFTCLLNSISSETGVEDIDSEKTVWQTNWCEVAWPNSAEVLRKDGAKIWFQTTVLDLCGQSTVWVDEKCALSLSQLGSKEEFLSACREGDPKFPPLSSIKIVRNPKDKDGKTIETAFLRIVDATDQTLEDAPTQATMSLLPMMRACEDSSAGIQMAPMSKIRQSAQYALAVERTDPDTGDVLLVPCQKVVSLVTSTQKTLPTALGEGYKMVTAGVRDAVFGSSGTSQSTDAAFELTTICTMENLASYRLDPPRGSPCYAIVTIVECTSSGFVVESVQVLPTLEKAQAASKSMSKLQYLALHLAKSGEKRQLPWSSEASPAQAKKCRVLGKSPTGPEILAVE
jgi:hypothetical protein